MPPAAAPTNPTTAPVGARILATVAFVLLAAHFHRAGLEVGAGVALLLLPFPWIARPWATRAAQAALVLGALEWLRTLSLHASQRLAEGRPVLRLGLILGTVALVTFASAPLLSRRGRKSRPPAR